MWLSEMIIWTFQRVGNAGIVRYGTLNGEYYRQFLPGGIAHDALHPPKKIKQIVYEFAVRQPEIASAYTPEAPNESGQP